MTTSIIGWWWFGGHLRARCWIVGSVLELSRHPGNNLEVRLPFWIGPWALEILILGIHCLMVSRVFIIQRSAFTSLRWPVSGGGETLTDKYSGLLLIEFYRNWPIFINLWTSRHTRPLTLHTSSYHSLLSRSQTQFLKRQQNQDNSE
jgi:hypothetical protein